MKKLILLLALISCPAFAASFTVKAFTGHIHNYSTSVSNQLEVIINWEFKSGFGRVVASGNKVVPANSAGLFNFQQLQKTSALAETFKVWVTVTDIKNNRNIINSFVDYVDSQSVAKDFTNVSIYNLNAINVGEIKTHSGKSIADWLRATKQNGIFADLLISYYYQNPNLPKLDRLDQTFLKNYDLINKSVVLNPDSLPLIFIGVDAGAKPQLDYNFILTNDPSNQVVYSKFLDGQPYTGDIPSAITSGIIIED